MNIGIIVYSQTGSTLKACEKIKTMLESAGHTTTVEKVEIAGDTSKGETAITITNAPDAKKYDALIFAAPVQAFTLAMPMKKFMRTLQGLKGKKAAILLTKSLPFKWTGGNQAISQMFKMIHAAGAEPLAESLIIWPAKDLDAGTKAAAEKLIAAFH